MSHTARAVPLVVHDTSSHTRLQALYAVHRILESRHRLVLEHFFASSKAAEDARIVEYRAAIKIQSVWRGFATRMYIKKLGRAAVSIQRVVRGHLARLRYMELVDLAKRREQMTFFHCSAAKIQAVWRGYFSRTRISNFYGRKNYIASVAAKGQGVLGRLYTLEQDDKSAEQRERQRAKEQELRLLADRMHHLLSTESSAGPLASTGRAYVNSSLTKQLTIDDGSGSIENSLRRTLDPQREQMAFTKRQHQIRSLDSSLGRSKSAPSERSAMPGVWGQVDEKTEMGNTLRELDEQVYNTVFPPIVHKPAERTIGPFKDPSVVHTLVTRPVERSVRLDEPYRSPWQMECGKRREEKSGLTMPGGAVKKWKLSYNPPPAPVDSSSQEYVEVDLLDQLRKEDASRRISDKPFRQFAGTGPGFSVYEDDLILNGKLRSAFEAHLR